MRSRLRLTLAGLAVFAGAAGLGGVTWAAFSSQAQNAGNSVSTAASFANMGVASGTYTGDGVDNRSIALPFGADVLIVKSHAAQAAVVRISTMTGDATKPLTGATALTANLIQSLAPAAFTVGTDSRVNTNGTSYSWTAFKAGAANLRVGTYTGNGAASRPIGDVGFSPEYAIVLSAGTGAAHQGMVDMTAGYNFDAHTGIVNGLIGNHDDGFTVGNSNQVNASGTAYHYVAFAERAGGMDSGTYTGNNTTGANVTGFGFSPQVAIVRANDTATARQGAHRSLSVEGTASQLFGATANPTTGIRALTADGIQLGNDASVNANGVTYHYAGFTHTANGCSAPGARTVGPAADAWVDQAAPTTNTNDTVLRVRSRSTSVNRRSFVSYTLPALPTGCAVTDAKLRLRVGTPVAGRTVQVLRNAAAFGETTVNWNNQPAPTGPAATATVPSAAGWMQWDVTSQVQAMYPPSTATGFQLRDATENGSTAGFEQVFDSRTAKTVPNRPQLVVTYG